MTAEPQGDPCDCPEDAPNVVDVRASSLTPEQAERYEDEALTYMQSHPYPSDGDLLAIMDRIAAP